ncbi:MAG: CHAT domain-containing protein [Magnetococcales bacterium]|nr:CHAT domain-containing protein [Magnetococcales bacterium]
MKRMPSVKLEYLRHGPPHNQLLSPLTNYLGVCGQNEAASVHVPYEHAQFLNRLRRLDYEGGIEKGRESRQLEIEDVSRHVTKLLNEVHGLNASLSTACTENENPLVHLRLTLSAAELSVLPFELAKSPRGGPGTENDWLLLQPEAPVTLTRRMRGVVHANGRLSGAPKILFIYADPNGWGLPLRQHIACLMDALEPWCEPIEGEALYDNKQQEGSAYASALRKRFDPHLTILPNATLWDVEEACRHQQFTHVHILAHGTTIKDQPGEPIGLALHHERDPSQPDVVDGVRFALALRPTKQAQWRVADQGGHEAPALVTVAACRSGHQGNVMFCTGSSFVHEMHRAGFPLVVGSQFPLTFGGSVMMLKMMLHYLLEGQDPRLLLYDLRRDLHALFPESHDWASIIAYDALPDQLGDSLKEVRYTQASQAINVAMVHIDKLAQATLKLPNLDPEAKEQIMNLMRRYVARIESAADQLRKTSHDNTSTRMWGIFASAMKRKAEALFYMHGHLNEDMRSSDTFTLEKMALVDESPEEVARAKAERKRVKEEKTACIHALKTAQRYYERAISINLGADGIGGARESAPHWIIVQALSLQVVQRPKGWQKNTNWDMWRSAHWIGELDLGVESIMSRIWAHSSLAELYLLLLAYQEDDLPTGLDHTIARMKVLEHAEKMRDLATSVDANLALYSTQRQFARYHVWWNKKSFLDFFHPDQIPSADEAWFCPDGTDQGPLEKMAYTISQKVLPKIDPKDFNQ